MRGQVTSGKWEDTPGTASAIALVLVGGDNPLTQVRPTNNTTVTKYLDSRFPVESGSSPDSAVCEL